MLKGIFGSNDNGSEVSSSSKRKSKRRDGDEEEDSQVSRRSRADSIGTASSKRKSSKRESTDQSTSFHPTSTAFSSTSRSPYADVAAPSVASSYATAYTEPSNAPIQRPEVVRNESMADKASRSERSNGSRRDSQRNSRVENSRSIDDDDEDRNAGRSDTSRRDSRRKPSRKDTAKRAAEDHDNSLPQNQFPGQEPAGSGVAPPYRPPGLASDYYGDHGESIAEQPGVRPDRPAILISADQAHLWEPTVEAKPPPEPSSMGHVGAAAEFFGGSIPEQTTNTTPSRPGKDNGDRPGRRPSLKPGKDSTAGGASPRSSPGPAPGRRPLPQIQNSSSIGMMGAGAAPLAAGAMAAGIGAAADYYTGNITITPHDRPLPTGIPGRPDEIAPGSGRPYPSSMTGNQVQSYQTANENMHTTSSTVTSSSRPHQSSSSNMPLYGAAAAAAGLAGAAYLAHEHTSAQHEQAFTQSPTEYQGRPPSMPFPPGQNQIQGSFGPQQQQQMRRRRTGPFGRFVDWFQDPAAIAEYEAYTEAIGVCKYCFEPGSSPAEAPRKHNYRRRRPSSGPRYGSSARVDKLTRYSSDENLRRRSSKKGYSTTEKVLATGLAGVGVAAVANEVYKNKNDFDDTYSAKSGRPDNRSRVSFQENEQERYSTSKRKSRQECEGLSKRDSDRRRQSGSEGEVLYEKRSSRRRESSGSDNRPTSRGGNLSTPVALAGAAAVGAALTSSGSRRRSRSKSPRNNRKGYYSKRVSPKHSYVDLNQTLEDPPSGPLGLGGFFSSPSSNSKRGKKKKGLFSFSNNSSSSSDADLVFGEGTVRRRGKRGRSDDRRGDKRQSGMGDTAAILGLAATGAALAAETSRRDDKGKRKEGRKTDSNRYDDDRSQRSRRDDKRNSAIKTKLQGYTDSAGDGDEGVWEDASDDDQSSVDMALAYGGRLSSRASRESLNEGTNILGWRFGGNQRKREEEKRVRRQSSKLDLSGYDPVKAGLVAGAAGLAGAAAVNYYSRPGQVAVESPPKELPPLLYVDPVPLDSREQTPRKQSVRTSVSPMTIPPPVIRTSDTSLEHPQPVTPINREVYQARQSYIDGSSGPVVFDKPRRGSRGQETGILAAAGTAAAIGAAAIAINDAERERKQDNRRSATMPTVVLSSKEGVSFDLTKEQEDREQRRERKRREKAARKAEEAASAARDAKPKASIITGAERSPERKLETWRLRDAVKAGGPGSMEPPIREPSPRSTSKDLASITAQPLPTPERETRLSEIDRQLEELYAQHREQEARKKREIEAAGLTAAGLTAAAVAVGVGVVAATSSSLDREKPRRKSSLRKSSKYRDLDVETESAVSARSAPSASASDSGRETASERLARKAARRVQIQRTPSPVHQHDDYTSFFVPPELKEHMAEHNRDADAQDVEIMDIVPGMKRVDTFPDELYHAYGTEDTDIPPTKLPWRVPMLELVSPTPPPRSPSITAEKSPVILPTSGKRDIGEPATEYDDPRDIEPKRSNSKVTWGDHEINVYEVITPEYEKEGHDFTTSSPEIAAKKDIPSSPLRQAFGVDDERTGNKDLDQPVPPVEKMTTEQREHVALGKDFADLPPSRDVIRDVPETSPIIEERKPLSAKSTPAMQFEQFDAGSTTGSFYQSPFASTVSDLDLPVTSSSSRVSAAEVTETPRGEQTEERISKSEQRRRERAESATEAVKVMPESTSETRELAEQHIPGGFDDAGSDVNVFDYMVTSNGSMLPSASVLGAAATSVLASDVGTEKGKERADEATLTSTRDLPAQATNFSLPKRAETFDESAFVDSFATPKRADTFDEGDLIDSFAAPKRAETFAEGEFITPTSKSRTVTSDPEDWEKTSEKSKKSRSKVRDDDDFYSSSSKSSSKKKSKRDSQVFEHDDDVRSIASSPADSRSKSQRKSSSRRDDDEDTRSVASDTKSAASEPTSSSKRKSKEKESSSASTSKKSGWALLGGLIGAAAGSKSDVSTKSSEKERKRESKSSDAGKRRSSKSSDRDRGESESRRSRSASQSSAPLLTREREESVDDAFVSADENGTTTRNGHGHDTERDIEEEMGASESFLAMRPDLPTTQLPPTGSELQSESEMDSGVERGIGASGLMHSESEVPVSLPEPGLGPESRDLAMTAVAPTESPAEQGETSTPTQPRQRRLSNLRTTDLGLGSGPGTASPARLGRFPVSPGMGLVRTGSVGSPPTALASSPLTTPRTRQGRPTSSDFRIGKEFRPLYLVERHSATKAPVQEEEERYPSLPSSRTSSAHPSLENLRGEYEDDDGDGDEQEAREIRREIGVARRYSWSDSQPRARSPDFLDSRAATPTQEMFPVGAGGVAERKEKAKEKPKYEFHSPSELLEDPAQHQLEGVPVEAEGSPLPSVVGTGGERNPFGEEVKTRSMSRSGSSKDLGLGLGIGLVGAAAGAFAVNQLTKADEPVSYEAEMQESKDEDFALQPVKGKRGKKDKKKRKTLDLANDDVDEVQDPRDAQPQGLPEEMTAPMGVEEPKVQTTVQEKESDEQTRDVDVSDLPTSVEIPIKQPVLTDETPPQEPEDEWAPPSKKSKKSKKDKKGNRKDSVPLFSTIEPEAPSGEVVEKEQQPASMPEPVPVSAEPTTTIEDVYKDDANVARDVPATLDTIDSTANLDEKASHVAFPFEASSFALPAGIADEPIDQTTSLLPSHKTKISAFEAAFEAARAARGLPEGMRKEVAMDGLVAPTVSAEPVGNAEQDRAEQNGEKNPFGDDYEYQIGAATSISRDATAEGVDKNPFGDDFEVSPKEELPVNVSNMVEVIPVIREGESTQDLRGDSAKATDVEQSTHIQETETPSEQVEDEVAWAPAKKSKKDKKSKRKSKVADDFEQSTPETGSQTPADAKPVTESRDLVLGDLAAEPDTTPVVKAEQIVQAAQEEPVKEVEAEQPVEATAEDEIAWAPTKKNKKDKKSKKKNRTIEDMESESQDTGSQTPANVEQVTEESRDLALPPMTQETEMTPVAEAEQIVQAAQEEPSALDPEKEVQPEQPVEANAAADDEFAWAPTKKSKKDGKSKKKSRTVEDFESESRDTGLQTPLVKEGVRDAQEDVQQITSNDIETTGEPQISEEPVIEPAQDDWAVPVSSKKSKKDKKAKKTSITFDDLESESPATTSETPANQESRDVPEAMPITEEPEEILTMTVEDQKPVDEPAEDEWAAPMKKSKKDKKSKKKYAAFDDFESESPATASVMPSNEESGDVQEAMPVREELGQLPIDTVQEQGSVDEPAENEWVAPSKKSKKDKKSKKKSISFDDFESQSPTTGAKTPINEDSRDTQEPIPLSEEREQLPVEQDQKPAEKIVEDEWAVPVEKSKTSKVFDDLEPVIPEVVTQGPSVDETRDLVIPDEPVGSSLEAEQSTDPVQLAQAPEEPAAQPAVDEFAWAPTKKSKKDKKSKRKTLDFDSTEPTETSTPASEPRGIEQDQSTNPIAPSTVELAAGALTGLAGASILSEEKDKPVEDDEWAPTSTKKSKKDKKSKKKGNSFSFADDGDSTPVSTSDALEAERDMPELVAAEEQAGTLEDLATTEEVERHATFVEKLSAEPEEVVPIRDVRDVPVENEWAAPVKKSKKDKKGKKKGSLTLLDEDQPAEETYQQEQVPESIGVNRSSKTVKEYDFPTAPESLHVDDVTGHYFGMLKDYQPAASAPDNKAAQTSRDVAQSIPTPAHEVPEVSEKESEYPAPVPLSPEVAEQDSELQSSKPEHDFPVIREVSHVNDVVDFHYGMLREYKPDTASIQKSKDIAEHVLPSASESAAASVPVEPEEDAWTVPVKKSKKDKKKKRESAFDDGELPSAIVPEESLNAQVEDVAMIDEPRHFAQQTILPVDEAVETEPPQQDDIVEPPATNEEDLYPVVTKKSKKDKKKKRQSTFDDFEELSTEQSKEALESDAALPIATGVGAAALGIGALASSQDTHVEQPVEDAPVAEDALVAEDEGAVPPKKSKKDKKKKRQSIFDDFDNEQTAPPAPEESRDVIADDIPPVEAVDTAEVPSERQEEVVETSMDTEEQPLEFITKKSKKDKKKKRGSTFDDFDTAPTTSAEDLVVSTLIVEPETIPEIQKDVSKTIAPAEDEEFVMPGKKLKKDRKKRHSTFEEVDMKEPAALPTEDQSLDDLGEETEAAMETREMEVPAVKSQEPVLGDDGWPIVQPASGAVPIEEDEWAIPTKKSKKDKKKKKTLLSWDDGEDSTSQSMEAFTPVEPAETRDVQMQEPIPASDEVAIKSDAQPAIVPDLMPIVVAQEGYEDGNAMRRQRHQWESIPGGWVPEDEEPVVDKAVVDEPAQLLEAPSGLVDEPTQDMEERGHRGIGREQQDNEPAPEDEDLGYAVKKSKKDKKGKKSRKTEATFEEPESREVEEAQIAAPEIVEQAEVPIASDESTREAGAADEWGFAPKKSKKDKKNKKGKSLMEEEVTPPEILAIPEISQGSSGRDAGGEDEWAVPTKKSKKDKKPKQQSTRDFVDDEPTEGPLPFPVNAPNHVDDIAGHYHDMLREYQPAYGAPDNKSLATSRAVLSEPGVPHVDDVIGHYYGMLRDYQPAEGAPDNQPALSPREAEKVPRADRAPSPVSDEETRRARRTRRKASPLYRDEEPNDLPGDRGLTPPADHDDMMNTALSVAAGLGLTGAAASTASARRDTSEARSFEAGQAAASTAQAPAWSFGKINPSSDLHQAQRDSGVQFTDSPTLPQEQYESRNRDSGYVKSPANRESWSEQESHDTGMLNVSGRPPRPQSPTSSSEDLSDKRSKRVSRDIDDLAARREPSPIHSTSKERSSKLFNSSPSNRVEEYGGTPHLDTTHLSEHTTDIHRSPSIHSHHRSREELREHSDAPRLDTSHLSGHSADIHRSPSIHGHHRSREQLRALSEAQSEPRLEGGSRHEQPTAPEPYRSIFGPYPAQEGHDRGFSPPKTPLHTISEHSQNTSPSLRRQREVLDVGEGRRAVQHQESGHNLRNAAGIAGVAGIGALAAYELSRDDQPATRAKSLGKSKANTKSSRSLHRTTFDPDVVPSSSTHDPSQGKGKEVERDMSDVYDGHGEYPGSPMSPTRPPSMRKRQSMQQIRDLETRLDELAAENRSLADAKILAERHLEDMQLEQHKSGYAGQEAVEAASVQLREKDEAIVRLQQELEGIRQDHARLSEVNAGLSDAHETLRTEHEQRYSQLEDQHAEVHQNWQKSSRELETLKGQHAELSGGMEEIVQHQIDTALAEKNAEIEQLQIDLEQAKEKINELEQQILSGGGDDILNFRDEDYFENACQSLCQHVQQWVLKFSKFSDTLVCRTTNQVRDEKLIDRFDLAILDGSDVDMYLTDRIKRRDVFMSVVMNMIFEYIFTRYLFGMDRDQRQTLKKLEKNLAEVGPANAVNKWRAMTLTLLAKREAFKGSRENDTEAVVLQIYDTLAKFLPPPQNLQAQVQQSLRTVMRAAVELSIEMRTQKAEYIMLPPLQPEYDTNGDLTRKVYFNASLMNERSGETSSNAELEAQQAIVRMVLFPLVVKKGNDEGEGEEEIVVCPAQVLVVRPDRKSKANSGRVVSAQSDRMSVDQMSRTNVSRHSLTPSTMDMSNVI